MSVSQACNKLYNELVVLKGYNIDITCTDGSGASDWLSYPLDNYQAVQINTFTNDTAFYSYFISDSNLYPTGKIKVVIRSHVQGTFTKTVFVYLL